MQERAWARRLCTQNPKLTLLLVNQEYPSSPFQIKIVQDFGFELTKNTPTTQMKITQDFGFQLAKNTHPPPPPPAKMKIIQDYGFEQ